MSSPYKKDFPILHQTVYGKPLVYLDSAASTQKPSVMIDRLSNFLKTDYANIHRGVYKLSQKSTELYEKARKNVQHFIHAAEPSEIVFVRGTTEAINLIAQTFGKMRVHEGDEVLISGMEHHSNIVPWQILCDEKKATLKIIPILEDGTLDMHAFAALMSEKTKLVSVVHVSNALGTVNPVEKIIHMAHERSIPVVVDGAQSAAHLPIDVQRMDCDFFVFSGHKVYGPTGVGVLYGKKSHLKAMPVYQGGGEMIESVTFEKTTYKQAPEKFEAGTPDIMGAVALSASLDYVREIGIQNIMEHETALLAYAHEQLNKISGLRVIGTAAEKSGVISFVLDDAHPHDIATIVDREGIAVRAGNHCAQPVMERFGVPATTRASFGLYNDQEDADALVKAILRVQEIFK